MEKKVANAKDPKVAGNGSTPTSKAKKEEALSPSSNIFLAILTLVIALSANSSHAAQYPLLGSILPQSWFRIGSFVSLGLGSLIFTNVTEESHSTLLRFLSVLMGVSAAFSGKICSYAVEHISDPTKAPLVFHALFGFPVLAVGGYVWAKRVSKLGNREEDGTFLGMLIISGFSTFALETVVYQVQKISTELQTNFGRYPPTIMMSGLSVAMYLLAKSDSSRFSRGRRSGFDITLPIIASLVAMSVYKATSFNPTGIVLSQTFSTTGFIQVGENLVAEPPFRYLRSDGSILGSVFLEKGKDGKYSKLGEPAQASFVLQDAVRLVEGPKAKNALVIGLGAGTSARSLIHHKYNTTVVEIDNAIYEAARQHFGLPKPQDVVINDAAKWVSERSRSVAGQRPAVGGFDVVIHDVFAGGMLPSSLFTSEFWEQLKTVMSENGVVAVNYVGRPKTATFRSAIHTLQHVFGKCRVFHDGVVGHDPLLASNSLADFVIFCSSSGSVSFRSAKVSDYSGSKLSEAVLTTLPQREIDLIAVLGDSEPERYLIKRDSPRIDSWGKDNVVEYWRGVRKQLPAEAWAI